MTSFSDGVYQFGGSPVGLPITYGTGEGKGPGKVFFVNPTSGSNSNKGTTMEKPFATPAYAYTQVTSNRHDVIALSANAAHAATDELAVTKNRVHFWGLDAVGRYYGQRSRWTMGVTAGTAIAIVQNTGVGNTWSNIKFDSSDTLSTSIYAFAEGGEYTVLEHCELYKSTDLDQTGAAELLMNGDSPLIRKCTIGSLVNAISGAILRPCVLVTATIAGKKARDVMFEECLLWRKCGDTGNRFVYGANATDVERMFLMKKCVFVNAKLAAAVPAQNVAFGATQTEGEVLLWDCTSLNAATAMSTTTGVFVDSPVPAAATSGISVQAS